MDMGLSENRIYQSHHLNSKFDDEHKWILEYPVLRQPPPKNTPLQFNRELNSKVRFENGSAGWKHKCTIDSISRHTPSGPPKRQGPIHCSGNSFVGNSRKTSKNLKKCSFFQPFCQLAEKQKEIQNTQTNIIYIYTYIHI
jgi:hypothetical protein